MKSSTRNISQLLGISILAIGLALLLFWSTEQIYSQGVSSKPANLDIVLLIDNSDSMFIQSDPQGLRIRAAWFLVDYLQANAETLGANYRVGMANFGTVVSDTMPLRLLQDVTVRNAIQPSQPLRFTDFRNPLEFALRELRAKSVGTGNKMAIILLTDGHPQLTSTPFTEDERKTYFEGIKPLTSEIQSQGISLFVLAIGDAQEDRNYWQSLIPKENYIPISSMEQLPDVYRRIVADIIGLAVTEAESVPVRQEVFFRVEPYLERVIFSFLASDPFGRITLTAPNGTIVTPTIGGTPGLHHAIFAITNPLEGQWRIFWEGPGTIRYWVDQQYSTVRISTEAPFPYVGQEVTIQANIVRNGVLVIDPLRLEMEVSSPKTKATVPLSPVGDGKYTGLFKPDVEGTYTLTARVLLGNQTLNMRQAPTMITILPLLVPPTATRPPAPTSTSVPTSTPAPIATFLPAPPPTLAPLPTPLETRAVPTPTSTPTLWWREVARSVFSTIEENLELAGVIVLLVGIAVAGLAWNRKATTDLESQIRLATTANAKIEAFRKGRDMLVTRSATHSEKISDEIAKGLNSLSGDETVPVVELYRSYVETMAKPEPVSGKGAGKSLVDFLHWKGEKEILSHYLGFEKQGSALLEEKHELKEKGETRLSISQSLMAASSYATQKKEEAKKKAEKELSDREKERLKAEVQNYERISHLMRFASKAWGPAENYPSELPQAIETMVKHVLSTLPSNSTHRDDFLNLYETMSGLLRGFSYNRDAVPFRLVSALSASSQIVIGKGVLQVTQPLVDQHLYPLRSFIDNLDEAEKKLTGEVILTVPEQGILQLLLAKWKEAAEADLLEKEAHIQASPPATWAYLPADSKSGVLRVILSNDGMVGRTAGEAENVSVSIEDTLTGAVYSATHVIRRILPRESGVRCDVPLGLSASAQVGKREIRIKISYEDLAIGRNTIDNPLSVDFRKWESNTKGEDRYDPTALDELYYATGRDSVLVDRIEKQLKGKRGPIFLSDIQEVVEELASVQSTFQPEWEDLKDEQRRVLSAISRLTSEELFHVKLFEIGQEILRSQGQPFNWSDVAAHLVPKWLAEDRGLFSFSGSVRRKWVAHQYSK